jgi:hypothetical protein
MCTWIRPLARCRALGVQGAEPPAARKPSSACISAPFALRSGLAALRCTLSASLRLRAFLAAIASKTLSPPRLTRSDLCFRRGDDWRHGWRRSSRNGLKPLSNACISSGASSSDSMPVGEPFSHAKPDGLTQGEKSWSAPSCSPSSTRASCRKPFFGIGLMRHSDELMIGAFLVFTRSKASATPGPSNSLARGGLTSASVLTQRRRHAGVARCAVRP